MVRSTAVTGNENVICKIIFRTYFFILSFKLFIIFNSENKYYHYSLNWTLSSWISILALKISILFTLYFFCFVAAGLERSRVWGWGGLGLRLCTWELAWKNNFLVVVGTILATVQPTVAIRYQSWTIHFHWFNPWSTYIGWSFELCRACIWSPNQLNIHFKHDIVVMGCQLKERYVGKV